MNQTTLRKLDTLPASTLSTGFGRLTNADRGRHRAPAPRRVLVWRAVILAALFLFVCAATTFSLF